MKKMKFKIVFLSLLTLIFCACESGNERGRNEKDGLKLDGPSTLPDCCDGEQYGDEGESEEEIEETPLLSDEELRKKYVRHEYCDERGYTLSGLFSGHIVLQKTDKVQESYDAFLDIFKDGTFELKVNRFLLCLDLEVCDHQEEDFIRVGDWEIKDGKIFLENIGTLSPVDKKHSPASVEFSDYHGIRFLKSVKLSFDRVLDHCEKGWSWAYER